MLATTGNSLTKVMEAVPEVIGLAGDMLDAMVGNPILVVFIAVGFVGIGLSIFRKMKGAARG